MALNERTYSVLLVSSTEKMNTALSSLFSELHYRPIKTVSSVSAAKREWNERDFDFLVINSPLTDDPGFRFAIDSANSKGSSVLVILRAESFDEIFEKLVKHGVFAIPKPISRSLLVPVLKCMESMRERMKKYDKKTLSLEDKMEEIRIVNRAKWLLINKLEMDEPQAHRHIEKTAMDECVSKRVIAERIIDEYADK